MLGFFKKKAEPLPGLSTTAEVQKGRGAPKFQPLKVAEVRRETTEEHRPDGVTLRRTVIEEVVLPPGTPPPDKTGPGTAGPTDA